MLNITPRGIINAFAGGREAITADNEAVDYESIIEEISLCVIAFLLSGAVIFTGIAPFGVAFCASCDRRRINMPVFLSSALGILLAASSVNVFKYIITLLLLAVLKNFVLKIPKIAGSEFVMPLLAGISLAVVGGAFVAASGTLNIDVFLLSAEVLLSTIGSYMFIRTTILIKNFRYEEHLTTQDSVSMIVLFALCILPLSGLTVGDFSIGRVFGIIIVIAGAQTGNIPVAAMCGTVVGLTIAMGNREAIILCTSYAVAGLVSAPFANISKFACALSFVITNGIITLYADSSAMAVIWLYEVMAGSVISLFIPKRIVEYMGIFERNSQISSYAREDKMRELASMRLRSLSGAFRDVFDTVTFVSDRLRRVNYADVTTVFNNASSKVCKSCQKASACWGKEYDTTMDSLNKVLPILRKKGRVSTMELNAGISISCLNSQKLCDAINSAYSSYLVRRRIYERQAAIRGIECEQFIGLADAMEKAATDIEQRVEFDIRAEGRITSYLESHGIDVMSTMVMRDTDGHVKVEIEMKTIMDLSIAREEFLTRISEMVGEKLSEMDIETKRGKYRIILSEEENIQPVYSIISEKKEGQTHSGDTGTFFRNNAGKFIAVLSDGMGSGKRASVDSTMAVRVVEKIMTAGFSNEMAVRTLNAAMLLNCDDDRATTIDISVIDLFSGECDFVKAGSAPTFVRRSGMMYRLEGRCIPTGIIDRIEAEVIKLCISPGDIIVMLSDGVCVGDDVFIMDIIEKFDLDNPTRLARLILDEAIKRSEGKCQDDMTVMVICF